MNKAKIIVPIILVVIVILGGTFYLLLKRGVFADTTTSNSKLTIASGTSFVPGSDLTKVQISQILNQNVEIFSYNDSQNPGDKWTQVKSVCDPTITLYTCLTTLSFDSRLGYVVKNPGASFDIAKGTQSAASIALSQTPLKLGKHITYWKRATYRARYFRNALRFTFSDSGDEPMKFQDAWTSGRLTGHIGILSAANTTSEPATITDLKLIGNADVLIKQDTYFLFEVKSDQYPVLKISIDGKYLASLSPKDLSSTPTISLGLNLSPNLYKSVKNYDDSVTTNKIAVSDDITTLGLKQARLVDIDQSSKNSTDPVADNTNLASNLKQQVPDIFGNFFLSGGIDSTRASITKLDHLGKPYTNFSQVVEDMSYYSGYTDASNPNKFLPATANWPKLKTLIYDYYFVGTVIPRLQKYSGTIKFWQPWNEPDGSLGDSTRFGVPAEVLSLITTGKVVDENGRTLAQFTTADKKVVNGQTIYFNNGVGGPDGIIKKLCSDCTVVSAGFYRPTGANENQDIDANEYFAKLNDNNYKDYVDAFEVHLNLFPKAFMGYTRYWDEYQENLSIYKTLCGNNGNCGKPLYSTEIGSFSEVTYKTTNFEMKYTREFQADDLIKRFIVLSGFGLEGLSWNGYLDPICTVGNCTPTVGAAGTAIGGIAHSHKGLYYFDPITKNYLKKPSFDAFKTVSSKLSKAADVELLNDVDGKRRLTNQSSQLFLYRITDTNKKKRVVAWCDPYWYNQVSTGSWNYEDKNCSVNVNLSDYDILGNVSITDRSGNITNGLANSVTITRSPIFIEEK